MTSRVATEPTLDAEAIAALAERICAGEPCHAEEARALLDVLPGSPAFAALLAGAGRIRDHFVGRALRCCSVVNVKAGNCSENCSYCAQAAGSDNTDYARTKFMSDDDIAVATTSAKDNGAQALGLVAAWRGVKEGTQLDMVCDTIKTFSQNGKVRPDVNLGILESQVCADRIKDAGAAVYGHNLETAASFFDNICSTHSYQERLKTIQYVKQAGMGLCSGGIIGMGESKDHRVEFMEQLRFIEPNMIPINFLNPLSGTKLSDRRPVDADEALITLAVFRFMLHDRNLMVAGGKEVVFKERLPEVFATGINAVMVGNYLTTPGTDPRQWSAWAAAHGLHLPSEPEPATDAEAAACSTGGCGCT